MFNSILISVSSKSVMRTGQHSNQAKRGHGVPKSLQTVQEHRGTIPIAGTPSFAPQLTSPQHSSRRPATPHVTDKASGQQNEGQEPTHPLQPLNTQIFHIEPLLLIKAIAMLHSAPQAPVMAEALGRGHGED